MPHQSKAQIWNKRKNIQDASYKNLNKTSNINYKQNDNKTP